MTKTPTFAQRPSQPTVAAAITELTRPAQAVDRNRIEGALLGVAVGEALGHRPDSVPRPGSLGVAMEQLIVSYIVAGAALPGEVARRNAGISGPAWLLPVAVVHPDPGAAATHARQLAFQAEAPAEDIAAWVAYVQLAGGDPTDIPDDPGKWSLQGLPAVDALTAARWVITTSPAAEAIIDTLTYWRATPSVSAAAMGLWGLIHGATAIPRPDRCRVRNRFRRPAGALLQARLEGPANPPDLEDLLGAA